MKIGKYIGIRLVLLAVFLLVAQLLHQSFIYPTIKAKEGWLQSMVERRLSKPADVLYFSSSTNQAFAPDDTLTNSISTFIQAGIKVPLNVIDTGAIHAGIFLKILERIPENKLPKTIVMDLNIRSFGANWIHSNLENSLQRNFVYWNNRPSLINHLFAATKWYDYVSPAEHLRAIEQQQKFAHLPFSGQHKTIKKWCDSLFQTANYTDEGKMMVDHFGFKIDARNQQLKNFDAIVQFAKAHKIQLIFVMLPENVEKMETIVDSTLPNLVHRNAHYLAQHFQKKGIEVLDLHDKIGKYGFFESFPTEHYRAFGRKTIANSIILKVRKG